MIYILLWLLMTAVLFGALCFTTMGWATLPISTLGLLLAAAMASALIIANELRRPTQKEYNRKKALYPPIPENHLVGTPQSGSIVFGKDYRTRKFVVSEPGHHCLICGSTGSGKTATCLIPSILSHSTGSAQIVDIKFRELVYKTANIYDTNTIIVDMNLKAPYVWIWDIFYKLPRRSSGWV
ncbi:MAG: type IV secretory system conjugative DNA transfer family protein [Faecousia sp.]